MRLIIAGDFYPQNRVSNLFDEGSYGLVLDEVRSVTKKSDYAIVNLECPIVEGCGSPIMKLGPHLKCGSSVVGALRYAGFDCVTLANNHIRDYDDEGVRTTLYSIKKEGIDCVGGGTDILEARRPLIKDLSSKKVAILNVCEHEFSIASYNRGGAAPIDVQNLSIQITTLRNEVDYIIVIVHGGHELYPMPSPRMQSTYRWLVDIGADAVINHHQHCFSGVEMYHEKPIFYGLGNLCADKQEKKPSVWYSGYMVELILDEKIEYKVVPYTQCMDKPTIQLLSGSSYQEFLDRFHRLSKDILDPTVVEESFEKYCNSRKKGCQSLFVPYTTRLFRALWMRGLLPCFISKRRVVSLLNMIECESHRDVLLRCLENEN